MANRQTRKTISVQRERYQRIEAFAREHSLATSYVVETLIDRFLESPTEIPPRSVGAAGKATRELRGIPNGARLNLHECVAKLEAFWAKQEAIKAELGDQRSRDVPPQRLLKISTCECGNEKQKGHKACDRCERLDGRR